MFLSKRANGIYYLWYKDEFGKKHKVSTKYTLKSDALKFLREFKESDREKKKKFKYKTLIEFVTEFKNYSSSIHTLKTQQSFENAFRELIRIIGDIRLDQVGVKEIENFLAQKKMEASDWTARKYYIHLASAFETAKRWNYLVSNPFRKVQKPKIKEIQPLFLTKEEMASLLMVVNNQQMKNLFLLAVSTGLRLGEILNLQWSDIDFISRSLLVRNSETFTTKGRKNRSIPLNDQIYNTLSEMRRSSGSELVFHIQGKKLSPEKVSKTFKEHIRKLGLNNRLHFHSLRHTFASWLVQGGVSLYEVQKLLGHSNMNVTQIYSHLQPERLHNTVNKISIPVDISPK